MRKTKNLYKYVATEIYLAGATEFECLKDQGVAASGTRITIGLGRSPKMAKNNAKHTYKGNCDLTPILGDSVITFNGKLIFRSKYSDHLINDKGEIK